MNRPRIIVKGNPNCIHVERIVGLIGECKCGYKVDYEVSDNWKAANDAKRRGENG